MQIGVRFARYDGGRTIGVMRVQINAGAGGKPQRHAGRKMIVQQRPLGSDEKIVILHRQDIFQNIIAIGITNIPNDIGWWNVDGRCIFLKRVQEKVMAPRPHGQLDPLDKNILRIVEWDIGENFPVAIGRHVKRPNVQLYTVRRFGQWREGRHLIAGRILQ
ncbi:MAG: hypothetical protein ALAOOOJD_02841 [bacterium]|nr:hypothetical protein [bacterium]